MLALQSAQGQPDVAGGRHVPDPDAVPARGTPPASQGPVVPAELPARQLARLSLLGQRAGAVSRGIRITLRRHSGAPPYIGLRLQLAVPIEIVEPAVVQVIRRE